MPEKLVFELSKKGRVGYTLEKLDVPEKNISFTRHHIKLTVKQACFLSIQPSYFLKTRFAHANSWISGKTFIRIRLSVRIVS